jgi:DNA polymerase elongation subunit (family B)
MLKTIQLQNLLFLDIETVPEHESFFDLDDEKQHLFDLKTVCISVGYFAFKNGDRQFRTTSFFGEEKKLLEDFSNLLTSHFSQPQHVLCGHNAKEFDFPFIARRMIINGVEIPDKLNLFGKKPWEIAHLDTMELWKFGDYKHYSSVRLLTKVLNIPSPKDDIDGSEVADVFYKEKDIDRIITYCEKDVVAVAQIFLRFRNESILEEDEILSV